ncbi:hypothetical protein [Nonomuraea insulae]|uniref:Uncharacterized protein n=1 Tax=Nonomuraea insulae TaxID=1616787 RepID=A0ABW1CZE9_9ACTN
MAITAYSECQPRSSRKEQPTPCPRVQAAGVVDGVGRHTARPEGDQQVSGESRAHRDQRLAHDEDARRVALGIAHTQAADIGVVAARLGPHVGAQMGAGSRHVQVRVSGGQGVDRGVQQEVGARAVASQPPDGIGLAVVDALP